MKKPPYIAVKVSGFDHFIWFEVGKVTEEYGTFTGREGWGKDGALTNLKCATNLIEASIESDTLQY